MEERCIFQLSEVPISDDNRIDDCDLNRFIHTGNPLWITDILEDVDEEQRAECIEELSNEVVPYCKVDTNTEEVEIVSPRDYVSETLNRLHGIVPNQKYDEYPLGWWKEEVCQIQKMLVFYEEELFTLHEFLLYATTLKEDHGIERLYIGSVFRY